TIGGNRDGAVRGSALHPPGRLGEGPKEPSGNKYSMSACSSRMNRVIPVTVEAMAFEAYRGQLGVGHSDAARIRAAIQFRPHAQPGPAMGGSDQAHDGGEVDERRAAPVHRDVRKQ